MSTTLEIRGGYDTPAIELNPEKGTFEIVGRSMPNNALKFYEPVLDAIKEYVKNPQQVSRFDFKMDFVSSSSTKIIQSIFFELEQIKKKGFEVKVNWYYKFGDEDMKELGDDLKQDTNLSFDFIAYE